MLPLFLIRLSKSEKEVLFYMTITSKEVAEMLGKRHDTLKIFCIWKSYVLLDEFQLLSHNGYY